MTTTKSGKRLTTLAWLGFVALSVSSAAAWAQTSGTPGQDKPGQDKQGQDKQGKGAAPPGTDSPGTPSDTPPAPTAFREELVTIPITIEEVDKSARAMTVRTPDGERIKVNAPADLKGFDKLKKGDKVEIDYYRAVAATVMPAGTPAAQAQQQQGTSTTKSYNERLGARQVATSGEVVSVNKSNNTVQLKSPSGRTQTVAVQHPAMQRQLQSLAPGDVVQIVYTEAVAVGIRPISNNNK